MLLLNFWVSTTMVYHCHDNHSIIYLRTLFLPQQIQWERELLQRTIDYSNCQIDPAPFQLVERTSLLKVFLFYTIILIILLHEKFLQFDWLRAMVFQLNLKYLHVKITKPLWVVV